MSRRDNASKRCPVCAMHQQLCICALTPSLSSSSSLTLLLHHEEQHKPTNSGALAARALQNSRVIVVAPSRRAETAPPPPRKRGTNEPRDVVESLALDDASSAATSPRFGGGRGAGGPASFGTAGGPATMTASARGSFGTGGAVGLATSGLRQVLLFPSEDAVVLDARDGAVDLVVPDGTWRQARKMRSRLPGLAELQCVTLPSTVTTAWRLREERREHGLATLEAIAAAFRVLEGDDVADALLAVFRVQVDRTLWLRGALRDHEVSGGIPEAARLHDPRGGIKKTQ